MLTFVSMTVGEPRTAWRATGRCGVSPLDGVAENPARSCSYEPNSTKATSSQVSYIDFAQDDTSKAAIRGILPPFVIKAGIFAIFGPYKISKE